MTTPADARRLRAIAGSVVVALLALAGHSSASGQLPSLLPSLAVVAIGAGLACGFARTARSVMAIAVFLAAMQALAHVVLWASTGHGDHHGGTLLPSPAMLCAHALAVIVGAWLLTRLEAVAQGWLALWAAMLGFRREATVPPDSSRHDRAPIDVLAFTSRDIEHDVTRRGPPHLFALACIS